MTTLGLKQGKKLAWKFVCRRLKALRPQGCNWGLDQDAHFYDVVLERSRVTVTFWVLVCEGGMFALE